MLSYSFFSFTITTLPESIKSSPSIERKYGWNTSAILCNEYHNPIQPESKTFVCVLFVKAYSVSMGSPVAAVLKECGYLGLVGLFHRHLWCPYLINLANNKDHWQIFIPLPRCHTVLAACASFTKNAWFLPLKSNTGHDISVPYQWDMGAWFAYVHHIRASHSNLVTGHWLRFRAGPTDIMH